MIILADCIAAAEPPVSMTALSRPPPLEIATCALFLDFDGTLVGFHTDPMAVAVSTELRELLTRLAAACGGALALISGRELVTLDYLLAPLALPAAGLHGLERRRADGSVVNLVGDIGPLLAPVRVRLEAFASDHPGVHVEYKSSALAVHYRAAPAAVPAVNELLTELSDTVAPELAIQPGHMVVEVRPRGADKGSAVADFMLETPFGGRRAVFIGDDLTDEHGFATVNARGGLSIKVGSGATAAQSRLDDPGAVMNWLQEQLDDGG